MAFYRTCRRISVFNSISLIAVGFALVACGNCEAQYSEPGSFTSPANRMTLSARSGDITDELNEAVDDMSADGGGIITLRRGTFTVGGISMNSNVHIRIPARSTLISRRSASQMFTFVGVDNCSVRSFGGRSTIRLPAREGVTGMTDSISRNSSRAFFGRASNNLRISGFNIEDPSLSAFSSIEFSLSGASPRRLEVCTDVLVRDCSQSESSYGYGLVQVQAGRDMEFRNLACVGGVTVRFETGFMPGTAAGGNRLDGMTTVNIRNTRGQAALFFNAHGLSLGTIRATRSRSFSSEFCVLIETGGWRRIVLRDTTGRYTNSSAPTRFSHYHYLQPESYSLYRRTGSPSGNADSLRGPSTAVIGNYGGSTDVRVRGRREATGSSVPSWFNVVDTDVANRPGESTADARIRVSRILP